jgi:hypothetical protein
MAEKEEIRVSYEFVENNKNELILVMVKPDDEAADDENAKLIYDGISKAILVRNENQIIDIPVIPITVRKMFKILDFILVTEMDGEDIDDVYEAKIQLGGLPSSDW